MNFFKNKRKFLIIVVILLMMGLFLYRTFGTYRTNSYQNSSSYSEKSNTGSYPKNSYNNNRANNDTYKNIEVTGTVFDLKFKTSKVGNKYMTFKIKTTDNVVYNCYSPEWLSIRSNDLLNVSGKYFETKNVGRYTFHNELDVEDFSFVK